MVNELKALLSAATVRVCGTQANTENDVNDLLCTEIGCAQTGCHVIQVPIPTKSSTIKYFDISGELDD